MLELLVLFFILTCNLFHFLRELFKLMIICFDLTLKLLVVSHNLLHIFFMFMLFFLHSSFHLFEFSLMFLKLLIICLFNWLWLHFKSHFSNFFKQIINLPLFVFELILKHMNLSVFWLNCNLAMLMRVFHLVMLWRFMFFLVWMLFFLLLFLNMLHIFLRMYFWTFLGLLWLLMFMFRRWLMLRLRFMFFLFRLLHLLLFCIRSLSHFFSCWRSVKYSLLSYFNCRWKFEFCLFSFLYLVQSYSNFSLRR